MSRAFWKGSYIQDRIEFHRSFEKYDKIVLYRRNLRLSPYFLNNKFYVYNGKYFDFIQMTPDNIGQNISSLSFTKYFTGKSKKDKRSKRKKLTIKKVLNKPKLKTTVKKGAKKKK